MQYNVGIKIDRKKPENVYIHFTLSVDQEQHDYFPGQLREPLFQNVCSGNINGNSSWNCFQKVFPRPPKCHFVHHFTPTLKLGPFHLEVKL